MIGKLMEKNLWQILVESDCWLGSFGGRSLNSNTQCWINRTYQRNISPISYDLTLGLWMLGYYLKISEWCLDFEYFVNLCLWTCICFENLTQYMVKTYKYFTCISLFDVLFFIKDLIVLDLVCYWFVMFWVKGFFTKTAPWANVLYVTTGMHWLIPIHVFLCVT